MAEFTHGQTIIREGERDRVLYILTEGEVDVMLGDKHITRFQPGAYFGEMLHPLAIPLAIPLATRPCTPDTPLSSCYHLTTTLQM